MNDKKSFLYKIIEIVSNLTVEKVRVHKQVFIKEIYEDTEEVFKNYYDILENAYLQVLNGAMSVDEAVQYFTEERLPFKASRMRIRGYMQHPYYSRNQSLTWFKIGIMGVLCGGMHDSIERFLLCNAKENDILEPTKVQFKGYHTIVDIINLYDRNNMDSLFYSDFYMHYLGNKDIEEAVKERLLGDIRRQINKIDKSWQLVCEYYPKLMF